MSTRTQTQLPAAILLNRLTQHTCLPDERTEASNLFYRSSISGTAPPHSNTTVSSSFSLPDISALNLGGSQSRLSLNETLSRGALGSVYRGSLEDHDTPSTSIPSTVIMKLVVGEHNLVFIKHEAFIYQHAKHLQGSVLPRYYGFYENEKHTAAFILLEDCGMPYGQLFDVIPKKKKLQIMQALKQIHDAGIEHGDLHPWNVLEYQGSPRIVDWHLAMAHRCPAKNLIMTEEFCCREGISELACEELVAIGDRMMFPSQDQIWYGYVLPSRYHSLAHQDHMPSSPMSGSTYEAKDLKEPLGNEITGIITHYHYSDKGYVPSLARVWLCDLYWLNDTWKDFEWHSDEYSASV